MALKMVRAAGCTFLIGCSIGMILFIPMLSLFGFFINASGVRLEETLWYGECIDVEAQARFKLPASAEHLQTTCSMPGQGWFAFAKFDLLPQDVDLLVESTLIDPPLSSYGKPDDIVFWNEDLQKEIGDINRYLYGRFHEGDGRQDMLIDTRNPERYTVYLVMFGG